MVKPCMWQVQAYPGYHLPSLTVWSQGCNIMTPPTIWRGHNICGVFSAPDDSNLPAHLQKAIALSSSLGRHSIQFKWKDVSPQQPL